jgi:hypothetical protein
MNTTVSNAFIILAAVSIGCLTFIILASSALLISEIIMKIKRTLKGTKYYG